MKTFASKAQRDLFQKLENAGDLVFACGPKGISVNLVGAFRVRKNENGEDQLEVGDGTCHVHIDWSRMKRFEAGEFHGEGLLTFFDGDEALFKLFRMAGPFADAIHRMNKVLYDV